VWAVLQWHGSCCRLLVEVVQRSGREQIDDLKFSPDAGLVAVSNHENVRTADPANSTRLCSHQ
jgi:hypothetical protein